MYYSVAGGGVTVCDWLRFSGCFTVADVVVEVTGLPESLWFSRGTAFHFIDRQFVDLSLGNADDPERDLFDCAPSLRSSAS